MRVIDLIRIDWDWMRSTEMNSTKNFFSALSLSSVFDCQYSFRRCNNETAIPPRSYSFSLFEISWFCDFRKSVFNCSTFWGVAPSFWNCSSICGTFPLCVGLLGRCQHIECSAISPKCQTFPKSIWCVFWSFSNPTCHCKITARFETILGSRVAAIIPSRLNLGIRKQGITITLHRFSALTMLICGFGTKCYGTENNSKCIFRVGVGPNCMILAPTWHYLLFWPAAPAFSKTTSAKS